MPRCMIAGRETAPITPLRIRENAADAAKAGEYAESGRTTAEGGSRRMGELQNAMQAINEDKAKVLYDFLDSSKMFRGTVE